jgi:uncharacterized protein YjiS (DUF1127 family)
VTNKDAQTFDAEVLNLPRLTIRYITPLSNSDDGYCVLKGTFSPGGVAPIHSHRGYETLVAAARRTSARRIGGDIRHLSMLGRIVRAVSAWRARARTYVAERQSLSSLARSDDHTLSDIGLNHADLIARWLCRRGRPRILVDTAPSASTEATAALGDEVAPAAKQ